MATLNNVVHSATDNRLAAAGVVVVIVVVTFVVVGVVVVGVVVGVVAIGEVAWCKKKRVQNSSIAVR